MKLNNQIQFNFAAISCVGFSFHNCSGRKPPAPRNGHGWKRRRWS